MTSPWLDPQLPAWEPWLPKDERTKPGATSAADYAKLYLGDATNRAGYNNPFYDISMFGSSLVWNPDASFYTWNGNAQPVPVGFFSSETINWTTNEVKSTGGVFGATPGRDGVMSGSPATLDQIKQSIYAQYRGKEMELKKLLQQKNYLEGEYAARSMAFGNAQDGYLDSALNQAILAGSAENINRINSGEKKILSFSEWLRQTGRASGSTAFGSGSGGTSVRVVHQKFDPQDYDIAIDQLFQQTVGRGASKEELDFFVKELQAYADANPQTVTTTTTGGKTVSTTTGGVSGERAASMMREQSLNTQGAEEYNKATKYLNYFMDALSSPIKLG